MFPEDFVFHYESITGVSEDGALVYTVTEFSEEEAAAAEGPAADVKNERDQAED